MNMGIRAYARLRGVSHTAVEKAIKAGRITRNPDGTIDSEQADREWTRRTVPQVNRSKAAPAARVVAMPPPEPGLPPGAPADPVTSYLRARAVNETFKAKVSQLEYEERSGKLIPAARAAEYAAMFSAVVKDALTALPDRLAPMLAAVDDEKAIHRMLAVEVAAVLKKVNKAVVDSGL
jgi:hypothetical protein